MRSTMAQSLTTLGDSTDWTYALKVCLWKVKIWAFSSSGNTQIFVFHKQTLRGHNSLEKWNFWACDTSFEKLISRALRCKKDLVRFLWKKSKKNSSEDRPFFWWFLPLILCNFNWLNFIDFSAYIFEKWRILLPGANLGFFTVPTPPYTCIFIHYRPVRL